jgi:hypothetical protein
MGSKVDNFDMSAEMIRKFDLHSIRDISPRKPLPHSIRLAHAQFKGGSGEFGPSYFQRLHHEIQRAARSKVSRFSPVKYSQKARADRRSRGRRHNPHLPTSKQASCPAGTAFHAAKALDPKCPGINWRRG